MKLDITLDQLEKDIKQAYRSALLKGYAGTNGKRRLPDLPGTKITRSDDGRYSVIDFWFTITGSPESFGHTLVYRDDILVWKLDYEGWYDEEVLPFLKEALAENLNQEGFCGGRGPETYERGDLIYTNSCGPKTWWRCFSGREEIRLRTEGEQLATRLRGEHRFDGKLMIKLE